MKSFLQSFKNINLRTISVLLGLCFFLSVAYSQEYSYTDSWGPQGFKLEQQKSSSVELTYSINSFSINKA
ncbi:MAG: hypothetical protein K9H58_18825, partial [Bacteroidales bacterium]|nr:hypothetical protein [Bacteroidales bacterium]